ncbi:hypothetical protein [Streptomyces albogriseolus]|uniref:hypothetical protein n=1 Tax=Streptomyces albogriseolus TaxID=1887 RepID=UPI0036F84654
MQSDGISAGQVVAVAECSSHAVLDAVVGGFKESERIVSDALDAHGGIDTLLPNDRGLCDLARWHRLRDQGTHLLWRIERRIKASQPGSITFDRGPGRLSSCPRRSG